MNKTRLIQRLKKPIITNGKTSIAHRVFGGHNMGLTKTQWDILDEIFLIDYMGSAEYENGIFIKTIWDLINSDITNFNIILKPKDIKPNFHREAEAVKARRNEIREAKQKGEKPKRAKPIRPDHGAIIYIICKTEHSPNIEPIIKDLAKDRLNLKQSALFNYSLDQYKVREKSVCHGWLELDNGFFFFSDEEMFNKTLKLINDQKSAKKSA